MLQIHFWLNNFLQKNYRKSKSVKIYQSCWHKFTAASFMDHGVESRVDRNCTLCQSLSAARAPPLWSLCCVHAIKRLTCQLVGSATKVVVRCTSVTVIILLQTSFELSILCRWRVYTAQPSSTIFFFAACLLWISDRRLVCTTWDVSQSVSSRFAEIRV